MNKRCFSQTENTDNIVLLTRTTKASPLPPGYLFASIFPPGGHTAPDVAFLFVSLQYRPDLGVEGRVVLWKTAHQVLVNGGFGNAKVICGCPYSSAGFDHVHSKSAGSFFYGLLHGFPSDAV